MPKHKYLKKIGRLADNLRWVVLPSASMKANKAALAKLKDIHKGQPALVMGNGPSLNSQDLTKIDRFISFGANAFFLKSALTGVHPTYLTVEDPLPAEDNAEALKAFSGSIKLAPYDLRYVFGDYSEYTYLNFVRSYRQLAGPFFPRFSFRNAQATFWGGTVVYMNLQLAAHMGCNPIYLTGMDLTYNIPSSAKIKGSVITSTEDDPNHFDPTYFGAGKRWHLPETDRMQHCLLHAYRSLTAQGFDIYNLTEGGNLLEVPRKKFTDVAEDISLGLKTKDAENN